ncbi:huntingtin-interacting protein 1 isoform X1 [Sigmodon hispidus]
MDRMASSMKQVSNPLPKVLSRRGVGAGIEAAERESFERTQVRIEDRGASLGHPKWCMVLERFGRE